MSSLVPHLPSRRISKVNCCTSVGSTVPEIDCASSHCHTYIHWKYIIHITSAQVSGPPKAGAFAERPAKPTAFRKFYDRGDFPIALEHDTKGNKIAWKVSRAAWPGLSPPCWRGASLWHANHCPLMWLGECQVALIVLSSTTLLLLFWR